MKKSKKGFTLVELLVTIILLGIVGGIIIYNMTSVSNSSKETEYERFVAKVKSAAAVYADLNPEAFDELYVSRAYLYITIEDLVTNSLLEDDLVNPYTNEVIGFKERIKANLDNSSGALTFTYPVTTEEEETFLAAISDYVVYGEPYNCMTGVGSYRLALSDEEGNLIQLAKKDENGNILLDASGNPVLDGDQIEKYNFDCTFDKDANFKTYTDESGNKIENSLTKAVNSKGEVVREFDYKTLDSSLGDTEDLSGTFDITYSWITESGTKKQAKRRLVINSKLIPEFIYESSKGATYDPESGEPFMPRTTDNACGDWEYLTYKPLISGADINSTVYTIDAALSEKYLNDPSTVDKSKGVNQYVNVVKNSTDYTAKYKAYDGTYTYRLTVDVYGHYIKDYSYTAVNDKTITQDLAVEKCMIDGIVDGDWTATKNLKIDNTYTINGLLLNKGYEIALAETNNVNQDSITPDFYAAYDSNSGKFIVTISAIKEDACFTNGTKKINYIYVRARNNNDYASSKWVAIPINLTNSLSRLVENIDKGCISTSNFADKSLTDIINNANAALTNPSAKSTPTLAGLSCVYQDKKVYVDYGTADNNNPNEYVVLGKYDSNKILVATDGAMDIDGAPGVTTASKISMTQILYKKWWVQTCDGLYSGPFRVTSPTFENLLAAIKIYKENTLAKIDNYESVIVPVLWRGFQQKTDYSKLPSTASYFNDFSYSRYGQWKYDPNAASYWSAWANATKLENYDYDSYVGSPNEYDYMLFGKAISSIDRKGTNYPYWLMNTFQPNSSESLTLHGVTLTYRDTHFLAVDSTKSSVSKDYVANKYGTNTVISYEKQCFRVPVNGKSGCENLPKEYKYAGATTYVKGMMQMLDVPVTSETKNADGTTTYKVSTC